MNEAARRTIHDYKSKTFRVLSVICFIASAVFFSVGFDKMHNYVNSDSYFIESHNAYVGGDAYNYIINGTYSTSYFVLGVGWLLVGCFMILIYIHANSQYEILKQNELILQVLANKQTAQSSARDDSFDDLPKL